MAIQADSLEGMGFYFLAVAIERLQLVYQMGCWSYPAVSTCSRRSTAAIFFAPFRDGIIGLFHQKNLAFPSGHSAARLSPRRWRSRFLRPRLVAGVFFHCGSGRCERVLENAHYVSDVSPGRVMGIIGVLVVRRIIRWGCSEGIMNDEQQFLKDIGGSIDSIPDQWNHRAHVKIAYLYLQKYPFEEASNRICEGIAS